MPRVSPYRFVTSLIFILLIVTSHLGASESEEPILISRGDGAYPPYEMFVDNKLTGTHIELIRATASRLGKKVTFITVPWKRALSLVRLGEVDALSYVGTSEVRKKFIHFLEGNLLTTVKIGFIVHEARKDEIKYAGDLKNLTPYKIGELRGFYYEREFEEAQYLDKQEFGSIDKILLLLRRQRLDLGIFEVGHHNYRIENGEPLTDFVFLKPLLNYRKVYLGFSKVRKHKKLAEEFAETMSAFKMTNEYREILKKYGLN